jgi:hypothetical protein
VPTGPIAYSHLGVPQAVTVVPSDVLRQRQPVAAAVVEVPQRPMVPARPAAPTRIESGFPPPPQGLPRGRDGERDGGRAPVVAVPGGAVPVSPRETGSVPPRDIPVVAVPGGAVPVSPRETGSVPPRDMPVVSVPPRDMPMAPVRPAPVVRSAPRPVDELPPGLRGQPPVQRAPGAVPPPAPVAPVAAPQPGSPAAPVAPVSPAPRMRHAAEPVPAAGPARDAPQRPERRDGARERAERQ